MVLIKSSMRLLLCLAALPSAQAVAVVRPPSDQAADLGLSSNQNQAQHRSTTTMAIKSRLEGQNVVFIRINPTSTSTSAIYTDKPVVGVHFMAVEARTADPLSHSTGTAGDDASSNIRTIFFEIVGACIGVATLFVAVLAFRRMPKQKQPDSESPPSGPDNYLPSQHAELHLSHSRVEPVELDAVQTAVKMRDEEPVIRNLNVQPAVQPPGTMVVTG